MQFPGVHINCGGGSDDGFLEMLGDMESKHSLKLYDGYIY